MSEIVTTEDLVYCDVHGWSKPTKHHKYPRSRGGGETYFGFWRGIHQKLRMRLSLSPLEGDRSNVNPRTCGECHPHSHNLYANKTPTETITHNVENLWGGEKRWVYLWVWQDWVNQLRKLLRMSPRERESGVTLQPIQTDRLRRTLEEELRIRKVVRELGLETLEGELQSRKFIRELGLKRGDLYRLDEGDKEVLRWAQSNGGKTRKELLEEVLGGRELGPDESIRSVVWRMRRSDPAPDSAT